MLKSPTFGFAFGLFFGISSTLMVTFYLNMGPTALNVFASSGTNIDREDISVEGKPVGNQTDLVMTTATSPLLLDVDKDDNATADQLYHKVKVLCWIMTMPSSLQSKAKHVRETWSRRCNIRVFISSAEDKDFPAVGLPLKEGRDQLYEKTKAAFKYVWEHYSTEADWFLKADDDTFVVVENLRYLLKDYDPKLPMYFGRKFKPYVKQGYMSGGAGYVLSNEATKRFVNGLNKDCAKGGGVEDVEIGRCLDLLGVIAGDSRDHLGKETFHPLGPSYHVIPGKMSDDFWYWKYNFYKTCSGQNCSSEYPISFHYVTGEQMYIFEYMIYTAKVYGMSHTYKRYPTLPYELKKNKR